MNQSTEKKRETYYAKQIREEYAGREETKAEKLMKLDAKIKRPAFIVSGILGVIGSLAMGGGMALVTVWDDMSNGLKVGIPGMIVMILSYPVYKMIDKQRKKKYKDEIIRMTNEIIGTDEK